MARFTADQSIERRVYTDPEVFRQEQDRIFRRTWQYVAHESELRQPGDYKVATIAGESYLVCRDREGEIRVFANACRHRGATLARGTRGQVSAFRCPYHAWTYDLQGRLIGVPLPDGYEGGLPREDYGLPSIRVETFCGMVFACVDSEAPPLEEYLGEAAPYVERSVQGLEVIGYNKSLFRGNWKFYQENFGDGYHPPFLHQAMGPAYLSSYHVNGEAVDLGNGHMLLIYDPPKLEHLDFSRLSAALGLPLSPEVMWTSGIFNPYPKGQDTVLSLFPNTIIPDIVAVTSIHRVIPVGPDRTLLEIAILGDPRDSEEFRAFRLRQSTIWGPGGRAGIDDIAVAERCQIGASFASAPPFLMARGASEEKRGLIVNEYTLRGFYREWRRYMGWSG